MTAEDQWVGWWCNTWSWAHSAWQQRFADSAGLSSGACEALLVSRPGMFLQSVGIQPSQPPPVVEPVLRWLELTASQRDQALDLAQRICFAQAESVGPDGQWCWALTKALRPGVWLPPECQDSRLLLGAWLGSMHWPRVRLAWPPDEVAEIACQAPENKLQTLWQAILWRITAV